MQNKIEIMLKDVMVMIFKKKEIINEHDDGR